MLVKYYNNPELAYATKNRYVNLSFMPFYQEEQKSILLGDGAMTSVKTSVKNICNYVTINDTRWYVINYNYLNGGQIELNLLRDVIGEFGLANAYGKINRGYTDSILKNKKELSLNQILKERKTLFPNTNIYGNYSVSTHNNELWGMLYLVKPSGIDPNTGKEYEDTLNINIPAFAPSYDSTKGLDGVNKIFVLSENSNIYISFNILVYMDNSDYYYRNYNIKINFDKDGNISEVNVNYRGATTSNSGLADFEVSVDNPTAVKDSYSINNEIIASLREFAYSLGQQIVLNSNSGLSIPTNESADNITNIDYSGIVVKENNNFYKYVYSEVSESCYGATNKDKFKSFIVNFGRKKYGNLTWGNIVDGAGLNGSTFISISSQNAISGKKFNIIQLSNEESGTISIAINKQIIDEPYSVYVFPLFDVTISGNSSTYNIQKDRAFQIFNTIIQYLSGGSNPYLVDAQVYPYCPPLGDVGNTIKDYPFFEILTNTYTLYSEVQLLPYSDIKKEYIKRTYSIVSPEKSGKFDFNYYDYNTTIENRNGINYGKMTVEIKTSLKPFQIMSYAVIKPEPNSLKGITYSSDLRGCGASGGGFEVSISSNAFQTYIRENSNYKQIFDLQVKELDKTHEVERETEKIQKWMNVGSSGVTGAIGGASLGGAFGPAGALIGGAIGAGLSSIGTTLAFGKQQEINESLREFESQQQKDLFNLNIGTIKNLPNSISRISSFNEIILQDFWFVIEIYECSSFESSLVDEFIQQYGYEIGVYDYFSNYNTKGWFICGDVIKSNLNLSLHNILAREVNGGIYIYD